VTADKTPVPADRFFVLQIQATADTVREIVDPLYALTTPWATNEQLSAYTHPVVMPEVLDRAVANLNVVATDFATDYGLVEAVKNLTLARLDLLHSKVSRRAYLSRTESPDAGPAVVTTSWNGSHFGYTTRIGEGLSFIRPGYPALASFRNNLYAGDLRVTAIQDDFLNLRRRSDRREPAARRLDAGLLRRGVRKAVRRVDGSHDRRGQVPIVVGWRVVSRRRQTCDGPVVGTRAGARDPHGTALHRVDEQRCDSAVGVRRDSE
jgi:hypothetical protein